MVKGRNICWHCWQLTQLSSDKLIENVWESWLQAVNVLNFHPGKAGLADNAQCNYADPCLQHLNTTLDQPRLLLISMFCESTDLRAIPSFRVKIAVARCRWSQKTSLICRSLSPCVASKVRVACQEPCGECPLYNLNLIEPNSHKQTEDTSAPRIYLCLLMILLVPAEFALEWKPCEKLI